jgi:hypothetical protein
MNTEFSTIPPSTSKSSKKRTRDEEEEQEEVSVDENNKTQPIDDDDDDKDLLDPNHRDRINEQCRIFNKNIEKALTELNQNAEDKLEVKLSDHLVQIARHGNYVSTENGLFCTENGGNKDRVAVYYNGIYRPIWEYNMLLENTPARAYYALSVNKDIVYDCYDKATTTISKKPSSTSLNNGKCLASMANCYQNSVKASSSNKTLIFANSKKGVKKSKGNAEIRYKYVTVSDEKTSYGTLKMKIFCIKYTKDIMRCLVKKYWSITVNLMMNYFLIWSC